uniref:Glycoside hydrolase family 5 domain-containing protein n=1 Tax=Acrobeloides nanus TaxID=290746 RepID=A0A914DLR8_9BILA
MSLFWSQQQTPNPFFNFGTLRHLKKNWNSNIVRAPLGIVDLDGHPGYLNNTEVEYEKMKAVIDGAIQNNIYVIVDWHDHQANLHLEKAKEFFKNISQVYGNDPHIIYEIWNEPDRSVNWTDIKAYSNVVIPIIRANAPDSLILVGAPTFAQDVDIAAADPLNYQNIAYTLHYYAAVPEHQQYLRNKALAAINLGKCVFISEYGTVWYTGGGAVDEGNSTIWWNFNDQYKLSYVNWAIWTNNPSISPNLTGANALTQGTTNNQMGMPSHWTTSGALVNKKYQTTNQGVK